jgi:hypothetical protein
MITSMLPRKYPKILILQIIRPQPWRKQASIIVPPCCFRIMRWSSESVQSLPPCLLLVCDRRKQSGVCAFPAPNAGKHIHTDTHTHTSCAYRFGPFRLGLRRDAGSRRSVPSHDNQSLPYLLLHYALVPFLCKVIRFSLLHDVLLLFWPGFPNPDPADQVYLQGRVLRCDDLCSRSWSATMPLRQPLPAQQGGARNDQPLQTENAWSHTVGSYPKVSGCDNLLPFRRLPRGSAQLLPPTCEPPLRGCPASDETVMLHLLSEGCAFFSNSMVEGTS